MQETVSQPGGPNFSSRVASSRRPLRAALSEVSFSMPVAAASPSTRARGKRIVLSFIIRVKLDRGKGREQIVEKDACFV